MCSWHTSNNNINNDHLWWLLSNVEQLVYNTLPLSYLQGILGVKGFTLASIKHKGVTFNCKGGRRWDKTNYLYSLTAIFYSTSAMGPLLCWPVGIGHEKIYSLGWSWAGFCGSDDSPSTAKMATVIYRCDVFILQSFFPRGINKEGTTIIPFIFVIALIFFLYAGCKSNRLVYG